MSAPSPTDEMDEHRPTKRTLLSALDASATSARFGALALSGLVGFYVVTIASLTHKDLLLNTPVMLPFLEVQIPLKRFFVFAPIFLLVVHSIVLVQHVMLRGTIQAFNHTLTDGSAKDDPLRLELNSYFFVQAYAGPKRSALISGFLFSASWLTLVLLPVLTFLYFQVAFLPRHDWAVTWAHRVYLTIDLVLLFVMGTAILFPDKSIVSAPIHKLLYNPLLSVGVHSTILCALFFSYCVATLPDSAMDRFMRGLDQRAAQLRGKERKQDDVLSFVLLKRDQELPAFWMTARFFGGRPNIITGSKTSLFARNLIVMNTDLVPDAKKTAEVSLQLRGRDLRYARLDGSDLHRADLTGADLRHANLARANIKGARLHKADLRNSNLNWADIQEGDLSEANLQNATLRAANLEHADLTRADLREAMLSWAKMEEANLSRADMRGAIVSWADLDQAKLVWADLDDANLHGATLRKANTANWQLKRTDLTEADFGMIDATLAFGVDASSRTKKHELMGVWTGEANQPHFSGKGKSYIVKLTIDEFGNGRVEYPGLSCTGLNAGKQYGNVYVFQERIDKGRDHCRDGFVKIRASGNEMAWDWYYADGRLGATGTLKRQDPSVPIQPASNGR